MTFKPQTLILCLKKHPNQLILHRYWQDVDLKNGKQIKVCARMGTFIYIHVALDAQGAEKEVPLLVNHALPL